MAFFFVFFFKDVESGCRKTLINSNWNWNGQRRGRKSASGRFKRSVPVGIEIINKTNLLWHETSEETRRKETRKEKKKREKKKRERNEAKNEKSAADWSAINFLGGLLSFSLLWLKYWWERRWRRWRQGPSIAYSRNLDSMTLVLLHYWMLCRIWSETSRCFAVVPRPPSFKFCCGISSLNPSEIHGHSHPKFKSSSSSCFFFWLVTGLVRTFWKAPPLPSVWLIRSSGKNFGRQRTEAQWKLNHSFVIIDLSFNVQKDVVYYNGKKKIKNDGWKVQVTNSVL